MGHLDSFVCTAVASMAPGTAHYFCLKAFAAFCLAFFGTTAVTFFKPLRPSWWLTAETRTYRDGHLSYDLQQAVLGTQIKRISREAVIQDPSLNGSLVNVCFQDSCGQSRQNGSVDSPLPWSANVKRHSINYFFGTINTFPLEFRHIQVTSHTHFLSSSLLAGSALTVIVRHQKSYKRELMGGGGGGGERGKGGGG